MIQVRVSKPLLSDLFIEGNEIRKTKVLKGVPSGFKLTFVRDGMTLPFPDPGVVVLEFCKAGDEFDVQEVDVTWDSR